MVRPATRVDLERFYADRHPGAPIPTVMALVGEVDGRIVGCGGIARVGGRSIAFCDLAAEGRRFRLSLVRAARQIMAKARQTGRRIVYAELDPNEPGAERWARSLGFRPVGHSRRSFKWQA